MAIRLPDELAPALRTAAEQLLAECGEAPPRDTDRARADLREFRQRPPRNRCWSCGGAGPLGGHHLADGTVVLVHKRCHRKIHKRG